MNIREQLIQNVEAGDGFNIDFKTRSLKCGKRYLVKDGKYEGIYDESINKENIIQNVRQLFHDYKYSTPSERGQHYRSYFKPLDYDDLTDEQLVLGDDREVTRAKLESYILGLILNGFDWDSIKEFKNKWFYQDTEEKDLVLLKEWF